MKQTIHAIISSIASIGSATFGSFFITEPNAITTIACIIIFGYSFTKYISANLDVTEQHHFIIEKG